MKEIKNILIEMITSLAGGISSKIVIGAITYVILVLALIILMFVNPDFPGLSGILNTVLITSGALLGLTTVENIKQHGQKFRKDDSEENNNN